MVPLWVKGHILQKTISSPFYSSWGSGQLRIQVSIPATIRGIGSCLKVIQFNI